MPEVAVNENGDTQARKRKVGRARDSRISSVSVSPSPELATQQPVGSVVAATNCTHVAGNNIGIARPVRTV